MVLLLSAACVILAAVLLGAWFIVGGGFGLIYAAMALAVVSMILLRAARWIGGSDPAPVDSDGPSPLRSSSTADDGGAAAEADARDDDGLPISHYDDRFGSEILRAIPDLDPAGLDAIEVHERGGRNRSAVLEAIGLARASALLADVVPVEDTGLDSSSSDNDEHEPAEDGSRDAAAAPTSEPESVPEVTAEADPSPAAEAPIVSPPDPSLSPSPIVLDERATSGVAAVERRRADASRARSFEHVSVVDSPADDLGEPVAAEAGPDEPTFDPGSPAGEPPESEGEGGAPNVQVDQATVRIFLGRRRSSISVEER